MRFWGFLFFFAVGMVLWKLAPVAVVIWWVCANPWLAGSVFAGGLIWGLFIVPAANRTRSGVIATQPTLSDTEGTAADAAYHNQGKRK